MKSMMIIAILYELFQHPFIVLIVIGIIGYLAYSHQQNKNNQISENVNNPLIQAARKIMPDVNRYRFIGGNLEKEKPEASYIDTENILADSKIRHCVYALIYYLTYDGRKIQLIESIVRLTLEDYDEISMEMDGGEDQIYQLEKMPDLNFKQFKLRRKFETRINNFNTEEVITLNTNNIEYGVLKDIIEKNTN